MPRYDKKHNIANTSRYETAAFDEQPYLILYRRACRVRSWLGSYYD